MIIFMGRGHRERLSARLLDISNDTVNCNEEADIQFFNLNINLYVYILKPFFYWMIKFMELAIGWILQGFKLPLGRCVTNEATPSSCYTTLSTTTSYNSASGSTLHCTIG